MEWVSVLSSLSIVQIIIVAVLIGALQRMGVDVVGIIKSLLKINDNGGKKETNSHIATTLATIKDNHLEHVQTDLNKLLVAQEKENGQHEVMINGIRDMNESLEDILRNGVRIKH